MEEEVIFLGELGNGRHRRTPGSALPGAEHWGLQTSQETLFSGWQEPTSRTHVLPSDPLPVHWLPRSGKKAGSVRTRRKSSSYSSLLMSLLHIVLIWVAAGISLGEQQLEGGQAGRGQGGSQYLPDSAAVFIPSLSLSSLI